MYFIDPDISHFTTFLGLKLLSIVYFQSKVNSHILNFKFNLHYSRGSYEFSPALVTIAEETRRLMYFLYNFLSQTLKSFETVIGPSKLRFLARPSTEKKFPTDHTHLFI